MEIVELTYCCKLANTSRRAAQFTASMKCYNVASLWQWNVLRLLRHCDREVLTRKSSWQVVVNSPEQGGQMGGQMGGQTGGQTAGQMGSTGHQTNSEVDTPFGA